MSGRSGLLLGALVLTLVTSCSASGSGAAPSEYAQSWSKSYADTTCVDWNGDMTQQQKFAASADILSAARDKVDGASGVAPDPLIRQFEGEITTACNVPDAIGEGMTLTSVTLFIYQDAHDTYGP